MHRSNKFCPISAACPAVCCDFDSAGFYLTLPLQAVKFAKLTNDYSLLKVIRRQRRKQHRKQHSGEPCRQQLVTRSIAESDAAWGATGNRGRHRQESGHWQFYIIKKGHP